MVTEAPKPSTIDDRLARIEDMLVKLSTKIDRIDTQTEATHSMVIGIRRDVSDLRGQAKNSSAAS